MYQYHSHHTIVFSVAVEVDTAGDVVDAAVDVDDVDVDVDDVDVDVDDEVVIAIPTIASVMPVRFPSTTGTVEVDCTTITPTCAVASFTRRESSVF